MIKKAKVHVWIWIVILMLAGCSNTAGEIKNNGNQTDPKEPIVVTDSVNRIVEIPLEWDAIATLDPFAGQCVIMYGHGDHMPATINGVKRDLLLREMSPTLEDAAVVKDSGSMNAEAVLSMGIDFMFVKSDMYFNDAEKDKLDKTGIPYIVIDYRTIEEQMEAFMLIGKALGEEKEAQDMIDWYNESIDLVEEVVSKVPQEERPKLYHSVNEALRTDVDGSLEAEWIGITGVYNVSLEDDLFLNEGKTYTNLEQIYTWDPDLIICNESGIDEFILSDPKWGGLRAVREKQVYQIPIGVSRWGHPSSTETSLGILWLADLLYADYFDDFDLKQVMYDYYLRFYEYDASDEMLEKILSGKGIRAPN
ncbi:ABC transporter substrate-binding protein [Alkalibacter rhizosphaerae]|uniref:ABC transporter substrate-binding protein n=1 Tax=Alkalibacter rhizosphaerae TaxID=2815577 RepID=A0A974XDI2_9FIRM|nr:ABC transporter substrate-binding protein [Alkalibacter rhizosphaerae]QSX07828.1 ABC transporter substrate-binding protein [Alkalibacter rhizosphaerae]